MRWFFIFFLFSCLSWGQSVHFKTITTKEGLSNNSINCIANHPDGAVWIGTWDGLNLFDGKQVKVYKHDPKNPNSIGGNDIYALLRDKEDRLWILSDGKQISLWIKDDVFQNYSFSSEPRVLSLDEQGNILVQLESKKWFTFRGGQFVSVDARYIGDMVDHLVEDARKKSPQYYVQASLLENIREQFPEFIINAIATETNGNTWIGTKSQGVFLLRAIEGEYKIIENHKVDPQHPYSLLSNEVMVLHIDKFDNIWVGTKDGGVSILPTNKASLDYVFSHSERQPHLPHETIRAIAVDKLGGRWIGYYTQGVFYQKKRNEPFVPVVIEKYKENKDWNRIRSLYSDSHGNIWIGTYAGVVKIEQGKQEFFQEGITKHFISNRTYAFAEDINHYLWVGSWGGVSKYNALTKKFEPFVNQDKLKQYHIRHISIQDNLLILATEEHGVVFYDCRSGEINIINQEKGLLGNSVFSTYADAFTGDLWVATLGGISVFDTDYELKKQIREEDGLPSHLVYSLTPSQDDVWISTTKGIASIDKHTYNVLNFSNYIGWQGLEFSEGAYSQSKKGFLLYGGNKGLNIIDPGHLRNDQKAPEFRVLLNERIAEEGKVSFFEPDENKLRLTLYPIGFNQYPINQFEYRIVGLFDDWRVLPQKEVNLDDLDHKRYQIEIRDTVQKDKRIVYMIAFEIEKPFFLQPYFVILFVIAFGVIILWRVRIKQRKMRKREIELKKQVRDRTKEVEAQKRHLANKNEQLSILNQEIEKQKGELLNLHSKLKNDDIEMENFRIFLLSRIKKPIVNTLGILEELNVEAAQKEELIKVYDMVREWNYIEQVKDFDTIELVSVEMTAFIEHLKEEWGAIKEKYGVEVVVFNEVDAQWVEVDLLRFKLCLRYLLYECYKYLEDNQQITVRFYMKDNVLHIDLDSESHTLFAFWNDNRNFSPYYRAFETLLQNLNGILIINSESVFSLGISIPLVPLEENRRVEKGNWDEFLEELQVLPKDKTNILVYAKEEDKAIVKQLLAGQEDTNLVYNHSVSRVVGNIEHYKYDALVLYNIEMSDRTLSLFAQIKKLAQKQRLLIFYIAETVDYFVQEQLSQLGVSDFIHLPVGKTTLDNMVFKRIRYDKENKESNTLLWKTNLTEDVIVNLSPNERLFRKGMEMMNTRFSDASFSVDQLTVELGVSKMKCYRLFKEFVEQSPLEILIEMRLQKAKVLIEKGDLTISEVCFECGFNDPKYFSKSFKKRFEHSPSHFKND